MATWLAVAYGTRREEAEARHREPGRLRRPPAAHQAAWPPRRHSLLQQGVARLSVGLRVAAGPTSASACAGWTLAAPESTRIALFHRSLHTPAASVFRIPRPAPPALPPPRGPSALTMPVTAAPAAPDPATHGSGPTDPGASPNSRLGNTLVKPPPAGGLLGPRRPYRPTHRSPRPVGARAPSGCHAPAPGWWSDDG